MEDSLSSVAAERDLVIAHPTGEHRLQTEDGKKRCLLVGPEGGFIDYEVELAQSLGATVAHLDVQPSHPATAPVQLRSQ